MRLMGSDSHWDMKRHTNKVRMFQSSRDTSSTNAFGTHCTRARVMLGHGPESGDQTTGCCLSSDSRVLGGTADFETATVP